MKHEVLVSIVFLILFVSSSLITEGAETETIMPLADTYVDYWNPLQSHGDRDYLEVSEYASGLSIVVLMFDISNALSTPSEVKLRLYCFNVTSSHSVGVHWCVNNTWNEENLTSISFGGFFRTKPPESVIKVDSTDVWYEWKVTNLVSKAMEENYDKITLTLEVIPPSEGMARFASKDQPWSEYSPQLVFSYPEPGATPPTIFILSPENKTYFVRDVSLTFRVSELTSWIGYSLDGQSNVTVIGNITISGLSTGLHSLIVYAEDMAENTGASEKIYFTIETQQPTSFDVITVIAFGSTVTVAIIFLAYKLSKKTTPKTRHSKARSKSYLRRKTRG